MDRDGAADVGAASGPAGGLLANVASTASGGNLASRNRRAEVVDESKIEGAKDDREHVGGGGGSDDGGLKSKWLRAGSAPEVTEQLATNT